MSKVSLSHESLRSTNLLRMKNQRIKIATNPATTVTGIDICRFCVYHACSRNAINKGYFSEETRKTYLGRVQEASRLAFAGQASTPEACAIIANISKIALGRCNGTYHREIRR